MKTKLVMFILAGALFGACQKDELKTEGSHVSIKPHENGGDFVLEADTVTLDSFYKK